MTMIGGAPYLILAQVISKAFTFFSNQVLLRSVSPEVFGIAAYLEFLMNTVLFFAREAERMAIQRVQDGSKENLRRIVTNFAFLPLILGLPISAVLYYTQRNLDIFRHVFSELSTLSLIAKLLALAIFVELCTEPYHALGQYNLDFKTRSKSEGFAMLAKCAATLISYRAYEGKSQDDGMLVLPFVFGQVAYSIAVFLYYFVLFRGRIFRPERVKGANRSFHFEPSVFSTWKRLFVQMIFKHLLTEGDTLLVVYLLDATQQGVYSVISNYGSIVARLLFQPIEESLRISFTKTFAHNQVGSTYSLMEDLIVFYSNFCGIMVIGGYFNGSFLLKLLLGNNEKWNNSLLYDQFPRYILYLPFLAFNGILEGFFSSACSEADISRFSIVMSMCSALVLGLLYVLVDKLAMDLQGLILANVFNMAIRIAYCISFIIRFYSDRGVLTRYGDLRKRLLLPLSASAIGFSILALLGPSSTFTGLAFSCVLCASLVLIMMFGERNRLRSLFGPETIGEKNT